MSFEVLKQIGDAQKKPAVVDVRSGDTVKVTQKIQEGGKFRLQVFEGVVIRTDRKDSHTARITVRKIASGVGVEKSFLIHSPLVEKIEVVKRSKVRRKNLSYLRNRSGKSARLKSVNFDRAAVNDVTVPEAEAPADCQEVHSGLLGAYTVILGVADHDGLAGPEPQVRQHQGDDIALGEPSGARRAMDRIEQIRGTEIAKTGQQGLLPLVGGSSDKISHLPEPL